MLIYNRPDGRTFRSKQEIKNYLSVRQLVHDLELFDFRLGENFYTSRGLEVPVRARKTTILRPFIHSQKKTEPEATPNSTPSTTNVDAVSTPSPVVASSDSLVQEKPVPAKSSIKSEVTPVTLAEIETSNFVPEEDGYRCPVEDCRKLFRRDNLLGVKEFTTFLCH